MINSLKIDPNGYLIRPIFALFVLAITIGIGVVVFGTGQFFPLLAFAIFLINIFCSFEQKSSKLFALFLLIVVYILMVAINNNNGLNGDYRAYSGLYNHFLSGGTIANISGYETDYGYMLLMLFISKLGISYNLFITILATISILLIKSTLSKITNNYNLVLVCYILSPFFYDAFQFRYFFAYSIVIYAMHFILFKNRKSLIKYTLLILFASLFHATILFFLFYLVIQIKVKTLIRLLMLASVFIAAVSFVTNKNIVDIIFPIIPYSKFETYTSGVIPYTLNPLTIFAIMLLILYFIFVIRTIHIKNRSYTNNQIKWINYLSLIILPLLLVSLDFERFLRPIMLINYALIAENTKIFTGSKKILLLFSLILILSGRQFLMFDVTNTILENNYIFNYLIKLMS